MGTIKKILKFSPRDFNPSQDKTIYLNLNVSDMCNYRCLKCFQGKITPSKDSFDVEELIDIIDQAVDELKIKGLYISGRGETFLVGKGNLKTKLQNYKKLINHANNKNIGVMQFTNGYYLDPTMTDFLIGQRVSIVVSLDTLNKQKYQKLFVPPVGSFQKVMQNLEYARTKFPVEDSKIRTYRLGINTAISHSNFEEVENIKDFCQDDIIFFSNYPMIKGNFRNNLEQMCTSKKEYEFFKQKVEATSSYHALAGMCQNGACGFYYNGLTIDVNGNVLLSPYDISTGDLFGNIKDYPNMQEAVKKVKRSIHSFLNKFPDAKDCPLRHPNYDEFPSFIQQRNH